MNKKWGLILAMLMIVGMGGLFAWEGSYIKPTFSVGFSNVKEGNSESGIGYGLDLDLIHSSGFTFGLQNLIISDDRSDTDLLTAVGFGYTYTADFWSVGLKIMGTHMGDGGLGFDINGTFWASQSLGISGLFSFYTGMIGDYSWDRLFVVRVGISARL